MPRSPRQIKADYCYHITTRCNNRDFRLNRDECRELLLYALEQCQQKYGLSYMDCAL
jgi:putative transposase